MENKNQFKSFDKVLVRNHYDKRWKCDFYSHKTGETGVQTIHDVYSIKNVIPYEGNEHLLGTTDEPYEEIKLEEGELVVVADDVKQLLRFNGCIKNFKSTQDSRFITGCHTWLYAIRFSDFNPNNMEKTRKHILCVKNGKIVKYQDGN